MCHERSKTTWPMQVVAASAVAVAVFVPDVTDAQTWTSGEVVYGMALASETVAVSLTPATPNAFAAVPGASVTLDLPPGGPPCNEFSFVAQFVAESACYGGPLLNPPWCQIRIVASEPFGGLEWELWPDSGTDAAVDSTDFLDEGPSSWESHALQRFIGLVAYTSPLPITFTAEWATTAPSTTLRLDDWTFSVVGFWRSEGCETGPREVPHSRRDSDHTAHADSAVDSADDEETVTSAIYGTGGRIERVTTAAETAATVLTPSAPNTFVPIPAASSTIDLEPGESRLFLAQFTSESACFGGPQRSPYCQIQIRIGDSPGNPAVGTDFAFDSNDSLDEGNTSWESHTVQRWRRITNNGPDTLSVFTTVEWATTSTTTSLRLDDWKLSVFAFE